jgi:hypothetical protein
MSKIKTKDKWIKFITRYTTPEYMYWYVLYLKSLTYEELKAKYIEERQKEGLPE